MSSGLVGSKGRNWNGIYLFFDKSLRGLQQEIGAQCVWEIFKSSQSDRDREKSILVVLPRQLLQGEKRPGMDADRAQEALSSETLKAN
jgi:hypothetical protein